MAPLKRTLFGGPPVGRLNSPLKQALDVLGLQVIHLLSVGHYSGRPAPGT